MADEILIIETPEHVELHFALATIGNRFLACAIDHLLQILAITLMILVGTWLYYSSAWLRALSGRVLGDVNEGIFWGLVITLALLFTTIVYFAAFETLWSGQTPGKRWLKLRVIQEDGRPITFFAALTRNLLRIVDMTPPPFYSVGICAVFASQRAKRLGDFVANTVVVKERAAEAPTFDEVFASQVIDSAHRRIAPAVDFQGDLRVLAPAEITVVENFLRRRYEIPEQPRAWLAWRVAAPLLEKMRPYYDPATFDYEGFLEELLARYRGQRKYQE